MARRGVTVARWPSTAPAPSEAPSPAPPPRPSGLPNSHSTSACSASNTTTSSCSGGSSPTGRRRIRSGSRCTWRTVPCSVPCTRTPRAGCRSPPPCAGRSRAWPSISRPGRERPRWRACTRPPARCRSCGARAARSRRRRGATCCSGRCWANSSGGSTRPTPSPPDRSRRGRVERARVGRAPGVDQLSRALHHRARAASPAVTSSPLARPPATRCWRRRPPRAPICATPRSCARWSPTHARTSSTTSPPAPTSAGPGRTRSARSPTTSR